MRRVTGEVFGKPARNETEAHAKVVQGFISDLKKQVYEPRGPGARVNSQLVGGKVEDVESLTRANTLPSGSFCVKALVCPETKMIPPPFLSGPGPGYGQGYGSQPGSYPGFVPNSGPNPAYGSLPGYGPVQGYEQVPGPRYGSLPIPSPNPQLQPNFGLGFASGQALGSGNRPGFEPGAKPVSNPRLISEPIHGSRSESKSFSSPGVGLSPSPTPSFGYGAIPGTNLISGTNPIPGYQPNPIPHNVPNLIPLHRPNSIPNSVPRPILLSGEQYGRFLEFKLSKAARLAAKTGTLTDFALLRFLSSRDFSVAKATLALGAALEFPALGGKHDFAARVSRAGVFGRDKTGRPIAVADFSGRRISEILREVGEEGAVEFAMAFVARIVDVALPRASEAAGERISDAVFVLNLRDFDVAKTLTKQAKSALSRIVSALSLLFPEIAYRIFLLDAPRLFVAVLRLIQRDLSRRTSSKFVVIGQENKSQLFDFLRFEEFPSEFGGGCALPLEAMPGPSGQRFQKLNFGLPEKEDKILELKWFHEGLVAPRDGDTSEM